MISGSREILSPALSATRPAEGGRCLAGTKYHDGQATPTLEVIYPLVNQHKYRKSPLLMGTSPINRQVSIAMQHITRG